MKGFVLFIGFRDLSFKLVKSFIEVLVLYYIEFFLFFY